MINVTIDNTTPAGKRLVEELAKHRDIVHFNDEELRPFTQEQLIERAKQSELDYLEGRFKTQEELEAEMFFTTQTYLQNELTEIETGNATFHSIEELDERLEKIIMGYENNL